MSSNNLDGLTSDNEARLLDLTMQTREDIIRKLTKNGSIPEDKADKALLVSMLDGVDRTILSKSRIKVDSKISDSQSQATALIANILTSINTQNIKTIDMNREIPQLTHVEDVTFVVGELDTGTQSNNIETFMSKFSAP